MFFGTITLIILYLILRYILVWITYFNNLDPRLGNSTWRWSYDYNVVGERDISDLDDKAFVRLRRKKNKIIGGAEAFLLVWKKIPKYKLLYSFFKLPIIFTIFKIGYEIVAYFLYLKNKKQLKTNL